MKRIFLGIGVAFAVFSFAAAQQKKDAAPSGRQAKDPLLENYQAIGSPLPDLKIVDTLNNVYTEKDFRSRHNFFLFMFNPTCGHCIQMAKLVGDHYSLFQDVKIAFMAGPQMLPYIHSFYQATHIEKYPDIIVGVDSAYAIEKVYNYQTLPQINIYDKKRQLIKVFHGDTPLDSLKRYID